MTTVLEDKVRELVEPSLAAMGYRLVQTKLQDGARRRVLQLMAERLDGKGMAIEDCEAISHQASALLDVEDLIKGAYQLEVSSPGIDRPLTRPEDYMAYAGHEAKLETALPIEGRKRFRGMVKGMENDTVTMIVDGEEKRIAFGNIRTAKLVLTDALIAAALKGQG